MLRGYVQWMIKVIHIEKDGALYTSETGDNFSLKERIRNKKICWFELFHILKRWSSKRGLEIKRSGLLGIWPVGAREFFSPIWQRFESPLPSLNSVCVCSVDFYLKINKIKRSVWFELFNDVAVFNCLNFKSDMNWGTVSIRILSGNLYIYIYI